MFVTGTIRNIFLSLAFVSVLQSPVLAEAPVQSIPLAELWVQTSAEYRALCYQTYGVATEQFEHWEPLLEKRADGKAYLPGSDKPVAIILDLDETVIDNSGFQAFSYRTGTKFNPSIWDAWVEFQGINKEAGRTVPGAVEFLKKAHEMGVTPIYISNRAAGYETATIKVLERAGLDTTAIDKRILLKHEGEDQKKQALEALKAAGIEPSSPAGVATLTGEGEKEGRRLMVKQDYDVLAYFGDVYGDFEAFLSLAQDSRRLFEQRQAASDKHRDNWGKTWFILPNPMYGPWSVGGAIPKDQVKSSLNDFGFEVFLRGRRLVK